MWRTDDPWLDTKKGVYCEHMTKALTALLLAAFLAPVSAAAAVGDYAGAHCDTGMTICNERTLSDDDAQYQRIHNLEVTVAQLQAQIAQQPAQVAAVVPVSGLYDARIAAIESRLSKLEGVVNFLQTTVVGALTKILSLLAVR